MKNGDLERLRALCLALPEATERVSHGEPAWFVRKAPQFASLADRHHDDRVSFWAAAPPGAQQDWVQRDPGRFFVPPYVGDAGGSASISTSGRIGTTSPTSSRTPTAPSPRKP